MPDIMHLMRIQAPPQRVYEALTTREGIRHWWTRDAALEATVGAMGEFGFNGRSFQIKVRVDELKPEERVRWQMVASGLPAFDGTSIVFELRRKDPDTALAFAHLGFRQPDDTYAAATTRWGYYLLSLKGYLERGAGTPNPDDVTL